MLLGRVRCFGVCKKLLVCMRCCVCVRDVVGAFEMF